MLAPKVSLRRWRTRRGSLVCLLDLARSGRAWRVALILGPAVPPVRWLALVPGGRDADPPEAA